MGKKTNNGFTVSDAEKYAPKSWGSKNKPSNEPFDFETSSGQTVLIKRITVPDILRMGLLDTLDFFSKALSSDEKAEGETPTADSNFAKSLMKNFGKMEETVDAVLIAGVIMPVVLPVPPAGHARDDDAVYVDDVPFEDKVELFTVILDTEGLSTFRPEPANDLGHVPDVESVQASAE